jgi:hypothetical protein
MQGQEFGFEVQELEDMDLAALFAEVDAIGDKYLSDEEIAVRDAELAEVRKEFWMTCSDATLDAL